MVSELGIKPLSETPPKELLAWVLVIATGAGAGSFGQSVLNPPRPNPFTSLEARGMEERLIIHFDQRLDLEIHALRLEVKESLIKLRTEMPPGATRDRVEALERWAREQDAEYRPPTTKWGL